MVAHTLCRHAVRAAHSQVYHHQANGRAESAGQQLLKKLTKLVTDVSEKGVSWIELLPKALRLIHDTPGESGLSPYEIVFGRHRPMAGLPYRPPKESEDATSFLERIKKQDAVVATQLNEIHRKRAEGVNKKRREPPPSK